MAAVCNRIAIINAKISKPVWGFLLAWLVANLVVMPLAWHYHWSISSMIFHGLSCLIPLFFGFQHIVEERRKRNGRPKPPLDPEDF